MPTAARRRGLTLLVVLGLTGCARADHWNAAAAANYLDRHAQQWLTWPTAARPQGTVCISCHTALPYLLARGALAPYYPTQALASHATEAVLNALILASQDARSGQLSAPTQRAFEQMWTLQETTGSQTGSWPWFEFHNEPWEAPDSAYFGATLAGLAIGIAPQHYRSRADIQARLALLQSYLTSAYASEPLLNRIDLLWATGRLRSSFPRRGDLTFRTSRT